MITVIGISAGEIWQYLDKHTEATLSQILATFGMERDMVLMSIGWLARERHIVLKKVANDYQITLRK